MSTHLATMKGGDCAVQIAQVLQAMDAEARAQVGPHFFFEARTDEGPWQSYDLIDHDDIFDIAVNICSGKYTPWGAVYELRAVDSVTPAGLPRVVLSSGRIDGGPRPAPWYRLHAAPLLLGALTLVAGAAGAVAWRKRKRGR